MHLEPSTVTLATSFLLGILTGSIITLSVAYRRVGRIVARLVAVVALAAGAGLLTWALNGAIRGETLRGIAWQTIEISQPSEAFGWSAGLLLGGIAALLLSFFGRSD
ncbi:MAG: hypothetical protein ACC628_13130 [Pirellulaceae bacterium]